jgi:hypothetical protein
MTLGQLADLLLQLNDTENDIEDTRKALERPTMPDRRRLLEADLVTLQATRTTLRATPLPVPPIAPAK